ncbi:MAG TPA: hypothetical protein VH113_00245 [Gemmatimonadales bacterium]|jgi:hypothetical protein|nr:hypothetical protein [Gemmatimonadales bacterium]
MYPAQFFNLFPPFPKTNVCFVAMSFADGMKPRWENVIEPGIREAELIPYRVDIKTISDSILTDILRNISDAKVILADVSTVNGARNSNVLYEVGIAHATRLPEEVVIFRSDDERLLFDLTNIRVNRYSPDDDPAKAREQVTSAIRNALDEVDLGQSLAVRRAVQTLDGPSLTVLTAAQKGFEYPAMTTMGQVLGTMQFTTALTRLLDAGLIEATFLGTPPKATTVMAMFQEQVRYKRTVFGNFVYLRALTGVGAGMPDLENIVQEALTGGEWKETPPDGVNSGVD